MKRKQPIEHIALAQRCVWVCIHTDIISSAIVWNTIAPTNCLHRSLSCCGMVTRLCNMRACAFICMCPSRLETRTKESSACASSVTANASCEMNAIADYVCSAATSYIMLVCAIAGALRPERLWTIPVNWKVWRNSDGCSHLCTTCVIVHTRVYDLSQCCVHTCITGREMPGPPLLPWMPCYMLSIFLTTGAHVLEFHSVTHSLNML